MTKSIELTVNYPLVLVSGVTAIDHEVMQSIANKLNEMYKNSGEHTDVPNGDGSFSRKTTKPYSWEFSSLQDIAEKTAKHMKDNCIGLVESIFSFSVKPVFIPGEKTEIVLKKGTPVRSTHPKYANRKKIPLARDQKVLVNSTSKGFYNGHNADDGIGWNPGRITWAGAGGYWKWIEI